MPGQRAAVSVPGSIDPTVDRLLRLDHPGEVVIHPLPKEDIEIRVQDFIDMLRRKKETDQEGTGTKRLSSQGEENFRVFALTEIEVKSEEEPSSSSGTAVSISVQAYKPGDSSSACGSSTRNSMDALLESGENSITASKQKQEEVLKELEQLKAELKKSNQLEEQGQQQQQQPAKKRKSKRKKRKTNKPSIPLEDASVPQPQWHPEPKPRPEPVVEHPDQAEEQPQAQPPSQPSVVAEYLSFFKAKEDEAKAMEQQQQQETQRPRSLYRLLKLIKPGEGEAGPSGRPTTRTTESAKGALRTESSSAVGYSRTQVPEGQYLYEDEEGGKSRKAMHMQRARDKSRELASVLEGFRPVTPPAFPDDLTDIRTLSPQTGVEACQEPATRYDGFVPLPSPLSFRTPTRPEQPQTLTPLPSKTTSPVPGTGPAALGSPFSIPLPDANRTWLTDEDSQSGSAGSTSDSTSGSSGRSTAVGADTMADGNGKRQALSAAAPATESRPPMPNAATVTTAAPAAFEDNDKGLEQCKNEDTAFGAEQPWTKVEKKARHRRSKQLLQKPSSRTNRNLVLPVLNVRTSLQSLQNGWASTAVSVGESSKIKTKTTTKQDSKKMESVAAPQQGGSSKKGETKAVYKKAGENKGVKSGGDFASGSISTLKEVGSNVKAVPSFSCLACNKSFASDDLLFRHIRDLRHWCPSTSVPPPPEAHAPSSSRPTSSEPHSAGSQRDKPEKSKSEAKDNGAELAIVSGLTFIEAESKTSARTLPSSSLLPQTSKLKMEEPDTVILVETIQIAELVEESSKKDAMRQDDLVKAVEISGSKSPSGSQSPPSPRTSLPTLHMPMGEVPGPGVRPTLPEVSEKGESQSHTRSPSQSPSDRPPPPLETSLGMPKEVPKVGVPPPKKVESQSRTQAAAQSALDKPPSPPLDPFSSVEATMAAEKAKMPVSKVEEMSVEKLKEEIEKLKEELSKFQTPPLRVMCEVTKGDVPKAYNGDVKGGEGVEGMDKSSSFASGRDIQDGGISSSMSKVANLNGKGKDKGDGLWTGSSKPGVEDHEVGSMRVETIKVGSNLASQPQPQLQVPSLQPKNKTPQAAKNAINQEGKTHGQARAETFRQGPQGQPQGEQREVAATDAGVKLASQPQQQLQRPSAEPKNKTSQLAKKVVKQERINNVHARTKTFLPQPQGPQGQPQRQQGHAYLAEPSTSTPYPYSQRQFQSETEAVAAYYHYRRNKRQALDMLPTKSMGHGGSKSQGSKAQRSKAQGSKAQGQPMSQWQYSQQSQGPMMPQYSQGSMMSQDQLQPMISWIPHMPKSQGQWQPMYQGQAPPMPLSQLIHQMATGSWEQLMSLITSMPHTISQAPPLYQVRTVSQLLSSSHVLTLSKMPAASQIHIPPMPQMQSMPLTQPSIHLQSTLHNNNYQGLTAMMSQMPLNAPMYPSQPMYLPQPTHQPLQFYPSQQAYQAPQPMYPAHQIYNPQTYYQESPDHFPSPNPYQMPPPPMNPENEVFEVPQIPFGQVQDGCYPAPALPPQGGNAYPMPKAPVPDTTVITYPTVGGSGTAIASGSGHEKNSVSAPATMSGSWRGSGALDGCSDKTRKEKEAKGKEVMMSVDPQDVEEVQKKPECKTQDPGQGQ